MNIDDVVVRNFCMEDYDAVLGLWDTCGLPFKPGGRDSREKIEAEIKKDTAVFLVAEKDGKAIGSVLGTHDGRKGWVNRLAVEPGFRHRGVAQLLLRTVEEKIHALGIDIIACLIEDGNDISMDFFKQSGYIGHRDIYYFSKRKHPGV